MAPDGTHAALADAIGRRCRLTGTFRLRSGQTADTYFDKYLFEADPELLAQVAGLAAGLIPEGTEVLAGLELGGVPVVTALSLETGLPAAFVRKAAKTYGTEKLTEGTPVNGRRVLIVEDVITTGGQVLDSAAALHAEGAELIGVFCVIDRSDNHHRLGQAGLELTALFDAGDLETD